MTLHHLLIQQDLRYIAQKLTAAADLIGRGQQLDYAAFRREVLQAGQQTYKLYDRLLLTPEHDLQEPEGPCP